MILIDYNDKRPIYEQIAGRFQALIISGVMEADEKLPSGSWKRTGSSIR